MDGVRVIQGTPPAPLVRSTLFLRMWRVAARPGVPEHTMASLHVARPGRAGYVIKELIPAMELVPTQALDKAVAIARRGDVAEVYVNADMTRLPVPQAVAG